MTRTLTTIKLTDHDRACIALLSSQLGLGTLAAVVRQGYRALAKVEGVALPSPPADTERPATKKKRKKNPKTA